MTQNIQLTLIKDRDSDMAFTTWINYLKLRFQTRQWNSSLDYDSYVVHFSKFGSPNGITVEFPFSIGDDTFVRRMGTAMETIYIWWRNESHYDNIECPVSDGLPEETYWVFVMNQDNYYDDFENWVDLMEQYFDENGWQHDVNNGHEIIYDDDGNEVGIYVIMPYPMTFNKFLDRMDGRLDTITYVTKTTRNLDEDELTYCYSNGFFDGMDDGELY